MGHFLCSFWGLSPIFAESSRLASILLSRFDIVFLVKYLEELKTRLRKSISLGPIKDSSLDTPFPYKPKYRCFNVLLLMTQLFSSELGF